jgi:3-dehydroquinate synthase
MREDVVKVDLGSRAYDIVIGAGLIDRAGARLTPFASNGRVFVITDATVAAAHGGRLGASLKSAGLEEARYLLAPGEASKTFSAVEKIADFLLAKGVERRDLVVAFGGGVVGDVAGFASAIVKRGSAFAQIPTTLLAQVDSSVGGKTAINVAAGKNLVGAFHQPKIVLADVAALATLPARELKAGYAEIVKYGALGDRDFFEQLEAAGGKILAGDAAALARAIKRSCEMKAAIVAEDEREDGARALLNLGHTFGHALEAAAGYSGALLHGEAVAAGMGLAFDYSVSEGYCAAKEADRLKAHLRAVGLPAAIEGHAKGLATAELLLDYMKRDKKAAGGSLALILVRRIGEAFIESAADPARLLKFLEMKTAERAG